MEEPVVSIRDQTYSYPDGRQALNHISLEVGRGEKVAVVGPNGAGKSTLFLHLNGIIRGENHMQVAGLEVEDGTVT